MLLEGALVRELIGFKHLSWDDLASWVSASGIVNTIEGFQGQVAQIVLVSLTRPAQSRLSHSGESNQAVSMLSRASQLLAVFGDWHEAVQTQSTTSPLISSLARWACNKGVHYEVSKAGELLPYLSDRPLSRIATVGDTNWEGIQLLHQPSFSATTVYQPPTTYHSHGSKPVDVSHSEVPAVVSRGNEDGQLVSNDAGYTLTPEDQSNLSMFKAVLRHRVGHRAPIVKLRKVFSSDHPLGTTESLLAYLRKLDDNGQLKGFSLKYIEDWWFLSLTSADATKALADVALKEPRKDSITALLKVIIQNSRTHSIPCNQLEELFPKPFRLFSLESPLHKYVKLLPDIVVHIEDGGRRMLSLAQGVVAARAKALPEPQNVEKSRDRHVQLPSSVPTSTTLNLRVPPPLEHSTISLKSIPVVVSSASTTLVGSIPNDGDTPLLTEQSVVDVTTTILGYRGSGTIGLHELASGLAARQPLYRLESLLSIFRRRQGFSLKRIGKDWYLTLAPPGADSSHIKVDLSGPAYHTGHIKSEELVAVAAMVKSILMQCSGRELPAGNFGNLFPGRDRLFCENLKLSSYLENLPGCSVRRVGDVKILSLAPAAVRSADTTLLAASSSRRYSKLDTLSRPQSPVIALTQPVIKNPAPPVIDSRHILTGDPSYVLMPQDEVAIQLLKIVLMHRMSGSITLEELGSGLARTKLFFGGAKYLLDYTRKLPGFALLKEGDNWYLSLAPSDASSCRNEVSIDAVPALPNEIESATALFKLILEQSPNQTIDIDLLDSLFPLHNRRFAKECRLYEYIQKLPVFQLSKQRGKQILSLTLPEVCTADEAPPAVDLPSFASEPSAQGNIITDNGSLTSLLTAVSHEQPQSNQPVEQAPQSSTAVIECLTGDPSYTLTAEDVDNARLIESFLRKRKSGSVSVELLEHMFPDDDRVFAQGLNLVDYFRLLPGFVLCLVGETMSLTLAPPATETVHPTTKPATTHVVALCREPTRALAKYYHSISAIIPYRLPVYGIAKRTLYTTAKYIAVQYVPLIAWYASTGASCSLPLTGILGRNDVWSKVSLSNLVRPPAVPSLVPVRGLLKVLRRGLR